MELQTAPGRVSRTLFLLLCLLNMVGDSQARGTAAAAAAAPPACRRRCGALEVPYPFGLQGDDSRCYLEETTFSINCSTPSSLPPKLFWGEFEVLNISVYDKATMHVWMPVSYYCNNGTIGVDWTTNLQGLTTTFSYTDNVYFAIGCHTTAYIHGRVVSEVNGTYLDFNYTGGCMSSCQSFNQVHDGDCSGIGCCQTSIPKGLWKYNISTESNNVYRETVDMNPCGYSILVEKNNYSFKASDLSGKSMAQRFPVVLDWYVGFSSCELAKKNRTSYACIGNHSQCANSTNGQGYVCKCSPGYHGNPYISDGCQDVDECQQVPGPCKPGAICINAPGTYTCTCPLGTIEDLYECRKIPHKKAKVAVGISLGIFLGLGTMLLVFGTKIMQKRLKKRALQHQRQTCFKYNYDIFLRQLFLCDQSEHIANRTRFFTLNDLEKATNKFDSLRKVGSGGHGVVYKGILSDLQVVAIKKSKEETEIEKEEFINEIILLSQMSHRNVVKLIGCCLESDVPLLVYAFISNGTLEKHLHECDNEKSLSWDDRIRIATEVSSALSYMHTKANVSIYHRDIKSSNILLDDALTAKISDFGASKTVSFDQTHVITNIQGTLGYLDPEYLHTGRLTEKSDVYSLGVMLVELITGKNPTSRSARDERNVIGDFIWKLENGILFKDLDALIVEEADKEEVESVAKLAKRCLSMQGKDRPTIKEVEVTLEELINRKQKKQNRMIMVQAKNDEKKPHEESVNMDASITITESTSKGASLEVGIPHYSNLAR